MMSKVALLGLIALPTVISFPWMGDVLDSDGSLPNAEAELEKRQGTTMAGCPYNPNHVPAAPATAEFPYLGAVNGLPATHPVGNIEVPTDGDAAHNFVPPGPNDIRGPCPGLNTAANHNVLPTASKIFVYHLTNKLHSSSVMMGLPTWPSCSMPNRTSGMLATTLQWRWPSLA